MIVIVLSMFAALLLLAGGTVLLLHALHKASRLTFLTDRSIDPHLWGYHFIGAGCLLSLVLLVLGDTPWNQELWPEKLIVIASCAWAFIAVSMSLLAVLIRDRSGASRPVLPSPNAKLAAWPASYRAFIVLGFIALGALAVLNF